MKGKRNWNRYRGLVILLALAAAVAGMSFGAFAQGIEQTRRYQVETDGTLTLLSTERSPQTRIDPDSMWLAEIPDEASLAGEILPEATPTYSKAFQVYSTYFDFAPMNIWSVFSFSNYTAFYLEYKAANETKWVRCTNSRGGALQAASSYTFSGLKADTVYQIRLVNTDGSSFYNTKFHTGKKSLKIKSVKVKAIKVKRHKARNRTPYLGLPLSGYYYYYTYKLKVTVKLKKKPGTKGIFINGEWVKGNKKTYTITFPKKNASPYISTYSSYKKPKGKFNVYIYSGFSKEYGGYSKLYKKRKKVTR